MTESNAIKRPILRYHGGKFILAKWITSHFPDHRIYVEPFGGAASVLLQKSRSYAEVYNDLDNEVVNLFNVCREYGAQLIDKLRHTPFSRVEFNLSYEISSDPIEQARRTVVRSFMGFGSASASGRKTGFRSNSNRSGTTPAHDWANYTEALPVIIDRLRGVVIENRDAVEVMKAHDSERTLFYVDPPYLLQTRYMGEKTECYRHEMSDEDHENMIRELLQLEGMVVLSGYDNDLYNDLLPWRKEYKISHADGAKPRKEVLWISPNCKQKNLLFHE